MVAGCANGQVAFWDISLSEKRKITTTSKTHSYFKIEEEKDKLDAVKNNTAPFLISSSIEMSHKSPVTELNWLKGFIVRHFY